MKRLALALSTMVAFGACSPIRDAIDPAPAVVRARGAGVALALAIHDQSVAYAAALAARPASRCRAVELPPAGPVTVDTTITFRRKLGRADNQTVVEQRQWRRDEDGNIASSLRLAFNLPDGRATSRQVETRHVNGVFYRAYDGRFVVADRVPQIGEELDADAFVATDSILSLVDYRDGQWKAALDGEGLCIGEGARSLPTPFDANLVYGADGRSGYVRWDDVGGATLIVSFTEQMLQGAEPVETPTELWTVDADPAVETLLQWRAQGLAEGWLSPPRLFGDWNTAASTEPAQ